MLANLKKLLSECHVTGSGGVVKTLAEANYDYCLSRASEEMDYAKQATDPEEANRRLILATRLITLARLKLANPTPDQGQKLPRKRRGRGVDKPAE